ncbi:hypothetical protein PMI42_04807 [Bradyrhizobium sp. YR681]|uniref:hypothetical protein n=1 Tax=Bradyrhizobium sp. YR681 TaxID=1144344 RepID=UPI00027105C7|nr:hypothetical protein [Bradyrhizobium sp. YR681]EJN11794.1 hypothetical protein PMI42_04807 [Bradyrhizobium sp. YR681]
MTEKLGSLVEYVHRQAIGQYWLDIYVDRGHWAALGPFATPTERQDAHDDMLAMMRASGPHDLSERPQ